jgi:phage antirepressor protein|nr:MAG TPA: KilAC domain protein [Caudoviricetes sp.]
MNELIKIENREEKQVISAKELYEKLGFESKNWSRWEKTNIENNDFFVSNQDYQTFFTMKNGNETKDYWITIEMAKHLCMISRTAKAHEIREYFIKIEQAWNTPEMIMKRALEIANKRAEEATQKLLANEHKIDFYNDVTGSETTAEIGTVAKLLNFKGVGRNTLFDVLRKQGVLQYNNMPYQKYVDCGYFRVIESKWNDYITGDVKISFKTVVYQKGVEFIARILRDLGYQKIEIA